MLLLLLANFAIIPYCLYEIKVKGHLFAENFTCTAAYIDSVLIICKFIMNFPLNLFPSQSKVFP